MSPVDHLLVFLLAVILPAYTAYDTRRLDASTAAGGEFDRLAFYRETRWLQWLFFAALILNWSWTGRPLTVLGFELPDSQGLWIGIAVLLALTLYLVFCIVWANRASPADAIGQMKNLGKAERYLPQTKNELHSFSALSVTAGVVEETVYRGFLLWYLTHWMPMWSAVVVASVVFGLAHCYQGAGGVARTSLVGLGFGVFYLATGSIWFAIVAHALLDILQGIAVRELLRKSAEPTTAQPA